MLIKSTFGDIAREMDRLFDTLVSTQPALVPTFPGRLAFPAVNISEDDRNLYLEAELPGLTLDDVEILATEQELTLKGTRNDQAPDNVRALRRERPIGSFERTLSLPVDIDVDRVEARLHDGVLSITLPKSPGYQPRKIEVHSRTS